MWTDHTDVRPTMLSVLGLRDDYRSDGRTILEVLDGNAVARTANVHRGSLQALGAAYKQLDAPFGALSMASLAISTAGIQTGSSTDDSAYVAMDARLDGWAGRRDALATEISMLLERVETGAGSASEASIRQLTAEARALTAEVEAAAP